MSCARARRQSSDSKLRFSDPWPAWKTKGRRCQRRDSSCLRREEGPKIPLVVQRETSAPEKHRIIGSLAELLVAEKVQRAGGRNVIVAYDRVRLDCVALLVHHLTKHVISGLAIHTGSLTRHRNFRITIRASSFFTDDRLWLILLAHRKDGTYHDYAYVIPSTDVPELFAKYPTKDGGASYTTAVSVGRSKKFDPYKVATTELGRIILDRIHADQRSMGERSRQPMAA